MNARGRRDNGSIDTAEKLRNTGYRLAAILSGSLAGPSRINVAHRNEIG
jgi:hypothetical protein